MSKLEEAARKVDALARRFDAIEKKKFFLHKSKLHDKWIVTGSDGRSISGFFNSKEEAEAKIKRLEEDSKLRY